MSNLVAKGFNFEGKEVRTGLINGEIWFVAKDVCEILEITKHRDAVSRLSETQRGSLLVDTLGGKQEVTAINEAGLYKLIFTSRKPEAERFTDWVASEVIPSIRKTGQYGTFAIPQTLPEALRLAADLAEQNAILLPKAESFDQFMNAENNQPMNTVAKSLGIGRNKLFAMLREARILMSDNTPYQEYIDRDYFVVKEKPITMGKQTINKPQTFVTPKGVEYIAKLVRKAA